MRVHGDENGRDKAWDFSQGDPPVETSQESASPSGDHYPEARATSTHQLSRHHVAELTRTFGFYDSSQGGARALAYFPHVPIFRRLLLTSTATLTALAVAAIAPLAGAVTQTDGEVDEGFAALGLNNLLTALLPVADGKTLVGGYFTDVGGIAAQDYLIRINADGTLDTSFTPPSLFPAGSTSQGVQALSDTSAGGILVGGYYRSGGQNVGLVKKVSADGSLDTNFTTDPQMNSGVSVILSLGDGTALVGGDFTSSYGSSSNTYLARVSTTTGSLTGWSPATNTTQRPVRALSLLSSGRVAVGRDFIVGAGGPLFFMDPDGLNPVERDVFSSVVYGLTPAGDDTTIAAGEFENAGGNSQIDKVALLMADGSVDTSWVPPTFASSASVRTAAIALDGKILIGGLFTQVNGDTRYAMLARLNADGSLDETFVPLTLNSMVRALTPPSATGGIIGGGFTNAGGITNMNRLARYLTFPRELSSPEVPRAPMQQYGIAADDTCVAVLPDETDFPALLSMKDQAWGKSWAWWPNEGIGGFVCTRQPFYTSNEMWAVR